MRKPFFESNVVFDLIICFTNLNFSILWHYGHINISTKFCLHMPMQIRLLYICGLKGRLDKKIK